MIELIITWKDFGIESLILGADHYEHRIDKNQIFIPEELTFYDKNFGVEVVGDGTIIFKSREFKLKKGYVAVINSSVEIYDEETFKMKYL